MIVSYDFVRLHLKYLDDQELLNHTYELEINTAKEYLLKKNTMYKSLLEHPLSRYMQELFAPLTV